MIKKINHVYLLIAIGIKEQLNITLIYLGLLELKPQKAEGGGGRITSTYLTSA